MAGKESKNFFTPLQKLSEVAPNAQSNGGKDDPEKHPAFGFKANLIRAIGNLIYRHKENQNLVGFQVVFLNLILTIIIV